MTSKLPDERWRDPNHALPGDEETVVVLLEDGRITQGVYEHGFSRFWIGLFRGYTAPIDVVDAWIPYSELIGDRDD